MQPLKKLIGQSKEIKENWTRAQRFAISFFVIFSSYDQGFISGRRTGRKALPLINL